MKSVKKIVKGHYWRKGIIYFLTWCLVLNTSLPAVMATPSGGAFQMGAMGTIIDGTQHSTVEVEQAQSIIHWNSLDTIGGTDPAFRQSLTFSQKDGLGLANSAVLNRVMSGYGTQFYGDLNAAGMRIFIVNPAGIVFGQGSTVNVTQLVASNLNISNGQFLSGQYEFLGDIPDVDVHERLGVINNGQITTFPGAEGVAEGVALIGHKILNSGAIATGPGGFVVMAAGDRVLLGQPSSNIIVEMDSVTLADPENPENLGDVINESTGAISGPAGTIVLAAGDVFSAALRVESGVGRVVQNGTIHADGTTGDGGSVTLTAGDAVVLGTGSLTTANGGTSNSGANGGEVIAYASELYKDNALVDFQTGAQIKVKGGSPVNPLAIEAGATFDGGLAELSGDHLYFNGTVDATVDPAIVPYEVPDPQPENPDQTRMTPEGGTLHIDPVNLTLADGPIPVEGAAMDTFYEKVLEAYSQAGVNTILEADYDITVENITDGVIRGGKGDIVLRTVYNTGGIEFLPATPGGLINTIVQTTGGGNIFMLAGSGGIKTGRLRTYEDGGNPGRIRIYTNNGGDIETRSLLVDGGNDVEVSIIASGNLTIDGSNDATNMAGVRTYTNKVLDKEDQTGTAYICLVSENGSVSIIGAVDVEAHGKEQTVARIHICADGTVYVDPLNGRVQAVAKTSSEGTAEAQIRIHAGSDEPAITVKRGDSIRVQANTSGSTGSSIGPLDFSTADFMEPNPDTYEQTKDGSHVFVQIADEWLDPCPDCPTPPDLPPPVEPPPHAPIAIDDGYVMAKDGDTLLIIYVDGVLGNDSDPDGDFIIALLLGGGATDKGGTVTLQEDGGFTYTAPEDKQFDTYSSDTGGDYALFTDSFEYHLQDEGGLHSNSATVTITAKNYVPVARPDSYQVAYGEPLSPSVDQGIIVGVVPAVNGDYDPDPADLLAPYLQGGLVTGPTDQGGTVTLNPDGSFTYTPPAGFSGSDSFTYYATDGYNNSGSVQVAISVGPMPPAPAPYTQPATQPAPGLEPVRIETSGCPALMAWAAAELGVNEGTIQIGIANGLASGMAMQACDACAGLKQAAAVLQDPEGTYIAALAQVINELASNTAAPTEEQMASIANAIALNTGAGNQYAMAGQYLDALAKYVGVLNSQMGFSIEESIQFATDKYVGPLAENQNAGVAAYVAARLAALGG